MTFQATLIKVHDPFHPMVGREIRGIDLGVPINACIPKTDRPIIVQRNGIWTLRESWDQEIADGDVIVVVFLPQGGGGGGSNPLRVVLSLAIMWIAPFAAGAINAAVGGSIYSTFGLAGMKLLEGAIGLLGTVMVSALLPTPKPPTPQIATALAAPSPTYNIEAQGNTARLDSVIPVQYGRLAAYPDFAAMPYSEFSGNEEYLFQLFCLGQGEYDIEEIRIQNSPISSFDEIETEIIPPGGSLTLFPANVLTSVEVSGQEAVGVMTGATYSQSGTTVTVTKSAHGLSTGRDVYLNVTSGTLPVGGYTIQTAATDTFTVTASSATRSGNCEIQPYLGPFTANDPLTSANALGIDIVLPRGLYYANDSGGLSAYSISFRVEYQQINDNGVPISGWTVVDEIVISAATTTPQRFSYRYTVPEGRYRARLRRTNAKSEDSRVGNDLSWAGMRAYLQDVRNYGNVTLIAMRMRASNNLSLQASRKINVIATRKLPTWSPSGGWTSVVATRSIAWAIADILHNSNYGAGLLDNRIDLQGLYGLDQIWASRGDCFDARFDNALVLWEALTKAAQAGRAKPFLQGGVVYVARDQAATLPVALYSMRNIVRGSFNIEYIMPTDETADIVDVKYFDSISWTPQTVPAALPDSAATVHGSMELFGVIDRNQAYREGLYYAACNRYRRKLIKFTTEMEGYLPAFGDLAAVQHDMPQWGQVADAVGWDADALVLTVSEVFEWNDGSHYIGLRNSDGSMEGPIKVIPGATEHELILATLPSFNPFCGLNQERTHVVFGWGETWRQPVRVVSCRPIDLEQVEMLVVNEDDSVHTADTGVIAPAVEYSQLPNTFIIPYIANLKIYYTPSDVETILLSWQPAPGADHYLIEESADGENWTRVGETSAASYATKALYGFSTIVRVAGVGARLGPWLSVNYGGTVDYMWDADDSTLMWDADDTTLMWRI